MTIISLFRELWMELILLGGKYSFLLLLEYITNNLFGNISGVSCFKYYFFLLLQHMNTTKWHKLTTKNWHKKLKTSEPDQIKDRINK